MLKKKKKKKKFFFGCSNLCNVLKKIKTVNAAKASQKSDITTKISKQNSEYFAEYFYKNINKCI